MLKLAIEVSKEKLQKKYLEACRKEKFLNLLPFYEYELNILDNDWSELQMVSVNAEGKILAYMSANLKRAGRTIDALTVVSFEKGNFMVARDINKFFNKLTETSLFRKVAWKVAIGNPAEKIYDKIIEKYNKTKGYNGRVVGIQKEEFLTADGTIYDCKLYEIILSK